MKKRLILDLCMFVVFTAVAAFKMTGVLFHEWLSLLLMVLMLWHMCWNWDVILGAGKKLFQPGFSKKAKFNFVWNLLLYTMMGVVMFSGLLISKKILPALGIHVTHDPFMSFIHRRACPVLYGMLGIHLGMHWSWCWTAFKSLFRNTKPGKVSVSSEVVEDSSVAEDGAAVPAELEAKEVQA